MVKAIVTDVDGVIVGDKRGVNFPLPNEIVIRKLKELHRKGIPVILNTAKFNRAVLEIIKAAELRNPHITDGGAVIIDPLDNKIIKKHVFGKLLAKEIVKASVEHGFYTEFYGIDDWYVQKDQMSSFNEKRMAILQVEHTAVDSLIEHVDAIDVIKIFSFVHNPEEKQTVEKMLEPFHDQVHYLWSHHPSTYPSQNMIITLKGVSKKDATLEVLDYLKIAPSEALGIGDTLGDWNFMEVCGYAGVVESQSQKLQEQAATKGKGKYFLGSGVDTDGFIEIIEYFLK